MLSMQAVTTTFYVNPAAAGANDANNGTTPQTAWVSLNPTKWVDGCVVMLSPGVHAVLSTANVTANVTLQGTSKSEVIIEGLSDDDIARGSESPQFFQVNGAITLTLKDISLRNFVSTVDLWGGMFNVSATSTLVLENVNISNAKLPLRGGAAISSNGTLNLKNVSFENCASSIGAVISIQGLGVATIDNATFKNNTTVDGTNGYKFGGAIHVNTATANVTINNSYFNSNICSNIAENPGLNYPVGGAIAFRVGSAYNVKLHVTNSVFSKNYATWSGGAIMIDKMGTFDPVSNIDLYLANNTFFENSVPKMHGQVFSVGGGHEANLTGSLSFVNNTFMHNGPAVPTDEFSSLFFNSTATTFNWINNVLQDKVWNASLGKFFGWGFVLNNGGTNYFNSLTFKGSVFDSFGGWLLGATYDQIAGADNAIGSNAVDSVLTIPTTGQPYLAISNANSIAINKGVDEFTFNGKNIVAATDARGIAKFGASKDAGAYEYVPVSALKNTKKPTMFAYPNPFKDVILLTNDVASISIYDLAGKKRFTASNVNKINVAYLEAGLYVVNVVNIDGTVLTQKMQK